MVPIQGVNKCQEEAMYYYAARLDPLPYRFVPPSVAASSITRFYFNFNFTYLKRDLEH